MTQIATAIQHTTQNTTTLIKEENIGNIGTLKVSKELQKIIDYLHYKIGATEWSGILFYKLTKGNIDTLKDLEFTATFCYPMNIGSGTYTEFDYTGDVVNAYDIFEAGIEQSTGLVHSHHSMSTFFSGTDTSELKENAKNYNYYISLVVNFSREYCAKVAVPTKTKINSEAWFKNTDGKLVKKIFTREEEVILIGDLKVVIEEEKAAPKGSKQSILDEVIREFKIDPFKLYSHFGIKKEMPQWLTDRIKALEEKKKAAASKPVGVTSRNYTAGTYQRSFYDGYGYNRNNDWGDDYGNDYVGFKSNNVRQFNTKPEQFLVALLNLDASKRWEDLGKSLAALTVLQEDEVDILNAAWDENIETLHEQVYGNGFEINKHALEALLELADYPDYVETSAVVELQNLLMEYAV